MENKLTDFEKSLRKKKAEIGYRTAIDLVALVSHEIYSRFNAMLTANSIILAIVGWSITVGELSSLLLISLPIMGVALCTIWLLYVYHGFYWQDLFREEAKRLEREYYIDTFTLISLVETESPKSGKTRVHTPILVRLFNAYHASIIVAVIFMIVYLVILLQVLWIPSHV